MNVYTSSKDIPFNAESCVTIGSFDGVHRGHRKILDTLTACAAAENRRSIVITFDPIPKRVLQNGSGLPSVLTTLEEKCELIGQRNVDAVLVIPFDRRTASLTARSFIEDLIKVDIGMTGLVIGHNHTLGRDARGNDKTLVELGKQNDFTVTIVDPVVADNTVVSSTCIRKMAHEGDMKGASRFLGYRYFVRGVVVPGKKIGRKLGFPTANIITGSSEKLIPPDGVYAVQAALDGNMQGAMAYIGSNPTLAQGERSFEVHVFGYNGDMYNKKMEVSFIERIRGEMKFSNVNSLRNQIMKDATVSKEILLNMSRR